MHRTAVCTLWFCRLLEETSDEDIIKIVGSCSAPKEVFDQYLEKLKEIEKKL